jgi:hypothetical protein
MSARMKHEIYGNRSDGSTTNVDSVGLSAIDADKLHQLAGFEREKKD